jgi:hypothetical protein
MRTNKTQDASLTHALSTAWSLYTAVMQRRSASSRRFKMGLWQKNMVLPGLMGVGVVLGTQPRKMICSETRRKGRTRPKQDARANYAHLFWGSASCCAYFIKVTGRTFPRNNSSRCLFYIIYYTFIYLYAARYMKYKINTLKSVAKDGSSENFDMLI